MSRFTLWRSLYLNAGPTRSYGYAWRLPQLAKPLGTPYQAQARFALALELFTLGRFAEAAQVLSGDDPLPEATALRCALACLQDESGRASLSTGLLYLADVPEVRALPMPETGCEAETLLRQVLHNWLRQRHGACWQVQENHMALRRLRVLAPVWAAQAAAIHAETLFWQAPRWAGVWLDEALAQIERYGQHHLKVRLLGLKAQALAAAGELREAQRFQGLAQEWGERQQARRYLRLFAEAHAHPPVTGGKIATSSPSWSSAESMTTS